MNAQAEFDPTSVRCTAEECGQTVVPVRPWTCPACGSRCEYGSWHAPCDKCGRWTLWTRRRYKSSHSCRCTATPQQIATAALLEQQRATQELNEQQRAMQAESRRLVLQVQQETDGLIKCAQECYAAKRGQCTVRRFELPLPYCRLCEHIVPPIKPQKKRARLISEEVDHDV